MLKLYTEDGEVVKVLDEAGEELVLDTDYTVEEVDEENEEVDGSKSE